MNFTLTREQVRRVDELAVRRYGIASLVLMENAGRNAAALIDQTYGPRGRTIIFCCPGNNGGDGCVIARHLHNAGWSVCVVLAGDPSRLTPDTATNSRIIEAMGLKPIVAEDSLALQAAAASIASEDVVVDALLGTGFSGEVRSPLAELIHAVNKAKKRAVVAVDLPSGLDCDRGAPCAATIRADLTVTFVARKRGFDSPHAAPFIGRVQVADIGAPRELIAEIAAESS